MKYDAFLEDCYSDSLGKEQEAKFLSRFEHFVGDTPIQQALSNEQVVTGIFYAKPKSDLSKNKFFEVKKQLLQLLNWLNDKKLLTDGISVIEEVQSYSYEDIISFDKIACTYFADYASAIQYVDTVGKKCLLDYCTDDTLNIKAYLTLFWIGLDVIDVVALRKDDLKQYKDRGRDVYLLNIRRQNRTAVLQPKQFEILYRCAQSTSYRGLPTGKKVYYKDNDLLLRAKAKESLSTNNIISAFKRFNMVANQCGEQQVLLSAVLQKNGLFESIYLNEDKYESIVTALMEILGCDRIFSYSYKRTYEAWKQRYYPQ